MKYAFVVLFFLSSVLGGITAQNGYNCHEPVDVAVIFDTSSYFGSVNFPQLKLFLKNLLNYFELTNNGLTPHIGFIQFSDKVNKRSVVNFRYSTRIGRLTDKIDRFTFDGAWGTRLDLALKYARKTLFTKNKGYRSWVPHVVFAITGSVQNWDPVRKNAVHRQALELRKTGIQLLLASVGSIGGNQGYLRSLVDSEEHLYLMAYPYLLYGISEKISRQVCPVPSTLGCPGKVDIGFIVDSSDSISKPNYNKMKYFMFSIAKAVNISDTGARAGVVIYSKTAEMAVKFSDHTHIQGFKDKVYQLKHMRSSTRIDLGLLMAHTQLFSPVYGGARPGVKKIAFIMTDGQQTPVDGVQISLRQSVQPLLDSGVKTFSIGIGSAVDKEELRAMVGDEKDVIVTESFDELIKNIQNITQQTCEEIILLTWKNLSESATTSCKHPADIAFLVDSSSDVSSQDFQKMKNFLIGVEKRFRISEFGSRHAVVLYGNRPEISIKMDGNYNSTDFGKAVKNLWPIGGGRESYRALELAEQALYDFGNGARRHAPKVVVMMTAGQENGFAANAYLSQVAKRVRDRGVVIMVVGVGSSLSRSELLPLVASSGNLFQPRSFNDLNDEIATLSERICGNIGPAKCDKAVDIAFIIDSSGSIMKDSYLEARNFVRAIADTFTISSEKTHVGLMIYSDEARIMAKFDKIQSHGALRTHLEDLPHLRGKTRIDLALMLAGAELFTGNGGMRWSTSVRKVAVVITDGRQSPAADAIRLDEAVAPLLVRGVNVIAVGVGDRIDRTELEMMVKSPDSAFWASSYAALRVQLAAITKKTCK